LNNNCHCFAQELSTLLGGKDLPDWIVLPERFVRKGLEIAADAAAVYSKLVLKKFLKK
jgi:hypothetical protein